MTGPAIALAPPSGSNALAGLWKPGEQAGAVEPGRRPATFLLSGAAMYPWWLRYRVPFALAPFALSVFAAAMAVAAARARAPMEYRGILVLSGIGPLAWITLATGLATFGAAIAFDVSGPHRVTRHAQNGFWRHLVAAPAIVNTAALILLEAERPPWPSSPCRRPSPPSPRSSTGDRFCWLPAYTSSR